MATLSIEAATAAAKAAVTDGAVKIEEDPLDAIIEAMEDQGYNSLWIKEEETLLPRKFDMEKRKDFLRLLATSGRLSYSAVGAGASYASIRALRLKDPVFNMAVDEAMFYYRDILLSEMHRRGVQGYEEGVVGGRNKDQILMVPTYSDKMLDLLARVHMPALQKQHVSVKGNVESTTQSVNINAPETFDFSKMPAEDLAMVKKLLENQVIREEKEKEGIVKEGIVYEHKA